MEFWLDTINIDLIRDATEKGLLFGVTTNPSILSEAKSVVETLNTIVKIHNGPLAVQVTETTVDGIVEEAKALSSFSTQVVVKIMMNQNGLEAIHKLKNEKIQILGTAVIHPKQVLFASILGVDYIAPYFSHLENPKQALEDMVEIANNNNYQGKILAASVHTLDDVLFCAKLGVDAITVKDDLYRMLIADHNKVEQFAKQFASDWLKIHETFCEIYNRN